MQDKVIDEIRKALHEKMKNCRPELREEWESFLIWHRKIVEEMPRVVPMENYQSDYFKLRFVNKED
jgi:hypothetical protein